MIEPLLFRHFGSKAALFREAMAVPFTSFVDDFGRTWHEVVPEETDEDELARGFVGQHGHAGDAIEPPGPGRPLDGGDDRRHGSVTSDLLWNQVVAKGGDRRGAHPGDPPRLPASGRLSSRCAEYVKRRANFSRYRFLQ